jgi:signal transduction histidine kinase/CheY-like chemotaxis protein
MIDHSSVAAADPAILRPVSLERARAISPFVLVFIALGLLFSEPTGVGLSAPVIAWNLFTIPLLGCLCIALWRRRVPERLADVALLVTWWLPICGTLISQYFSHSQLLAFAYLIEIAGASFMLNRTHLLLSFVVFNAAWVPLTLRDGGAQTEIQLTSMFAAQLFTALFQRMHTATLLRAESTARALAKQLEERNRLHEQLLHSQRMEAVGTLAAGLAHDMNNVLGSMSNIAELLLDDAGNHQREDLHDIVKQARRGADLTRGLLAFSRKGQYRNLVLDVADVLREVEPLLARTLPKTVTLETKLADHPMHVKGDPAHLQQVLINLGVNAADAMNGAGALTISCEETTIADHQAPALHIPPGRYAHLRVTDTGSGMDEATRSRAFEPFFTTKALGKGTGLGLSTVWGIVQSHGGTITIDSELGRGTSFSIYLPITKELPTPTQKRAPTAPLQPALVLVADDEPVLRTSTIRLLERQGLRALGANNGAEALELYDKHAGEVALVVLDMGMPVMGGAECFAQLRKRGNVPVLIATGFAIDADARAMIEQGAALIEKPYASTALIAEVRKLLAKNRGTT